MAESLLIGLGALVLSPGLTLASLLAVSGACSGHGGVSCSAGPDSDGSVICVDSWRGSSVQYSTMVMCMGQSTPKPTPSAAATPKSTPTSEPSKSVGTPNPVETPKSAGTPIVTAKPVDAISGSVAGVREDYIANHHGYRERLIEALVAEFGEAMRDRIAYAVYTTLLDVK